MDNLINGRNVEKLKKGLDNFHLAVDDEKINQFLLYYDVLIEWNSFMNLTTITDFEEVVLKHFIDSISLVKAIPDLSEKKYNLIDIGTGAGFPGIVLAILCPQYTFTLVDSLMKRIEFLHIIKEELQLDHVSLHHGRAEDLGHQIKFRNQFDFVVSRAVAELPVLLEYSIPFVKEQGYFVSYKGKRCREEVEISHRALEELSAEIVEVEEYSLAKESRFLIFIKNLSITDVRYPRKAGKVKKKPLY